MKKQPVIILIFLLLVIVGGYFFISRESSFNLDQQNLEARKTVEDYFIENMNASPEEAKEMAKDGVDLRVSENTTLMGIVGNLYAYGFIDNEDAFNNLLEKTPDTTPGREGAIRVGNNTVDIQTNYYLNYTMTDEQIADTLLNKGTFEENFKRYNYLFMPSGPGKGPGQRSER